MLGWLRKRRPLNYERRKAREHVPPLQPRFRVVGRREPERRKVVKVSPEAVAEIRRVAAEVRGWVVRIQTNVVEFDGLVPKYFQSFVDIDTHVDPETDLLDDSQGVPVAIDRRTALYMEGFLLDWQSGNAAGFALRGPNEPK